MTAGGHFERVAVVYESLRTTDEAPVRRIGLFLPDRPVTGLDIGCGTGRYTRLLRGLLPEGSRLAASDVSAAMLSQLKAGNHGHASGVVPLLSAAEELPWRTASLDVVTAFNCVHHFDLGRFLTAVARVLQPDGQLFVYTRTPQQNARTIWGRYFPGFTEHERRLHSEAEFRDAVGRTAGLTLVAAQTFHHPRTSTAGRLRAQAEGRHYSTFSLYRPEELRAAITTFVGGSRRGHPPGGAADGQHGRSELPIVNFILQTVTARDQGPGMRDLDDRHPRHRARYGTDPRPRPMGQGMELAGRRRDGSTFPAEISLSSIDTDQGVLATAAVRDVSDRLEVQAERERLKTQAERNRLERQLLQSQRLESLGQLAGGGAHDFNNLLGVISSYAAFVADEVNRPAVTGLSESVPADIEQVQLAAQRAAGLTHQLLAFARREVVQATVLNLNEIVASVLMLLRRTLGEHVELVTELDPKLDQVLADPGHIEQILVNLAINARDAMPSGGRLTMRPRTSRWTRRTRSAALTCLLGVA